MVPRRSVLTYPLIRLFLQLSLTPAKPTPSLPAPGVGGALAMNTAKRSRLAASQQWGLVLGCELHASLHLHRSLSLGPTAWLLPPALHHGLESSEFCWPLGCGFCAGKAAMTPLILPLERPIHPGPTGPRGLGSPWQPPPPSRALAGLPHRGPKQSPAARLWGGSISRGRPRTASSLDGNVSVAQSFLTVCNTVDCSPPGSSVHRILQARILEWVVMPFSRGSSRPRD